METFFKKLSLFQINPARSSRILFPLLGALGRISMAGELWNCAAHEKYVAPIEQSTAAAIDIIPILISQTYVSSAKSYNIP